MLFSLEDSHAASLKDRNRASRAPPEIDRSRGGFRHRSNRRRCTA